MLRARLLFSLTALPVAAQLIPTGASIPKGAKPPVVFLNGYENSCAGSKFSDTFGKFDQFFQAINRASLFFDNCAFSGKPSIEELGNNLGAFLKALTYTDGTPVQQVDVVAHSMGGLITRSYLAGLQTDGTLKPPLIPAIRKAIFVATPHFGTDIASVFGFDVQTQELATASSFVYTLGTWNQGSDDLRGIDALAVVGNGGSGFVNGAASGDGVSNLTSASIGFAEPMRTRVLPYCHIPDSFLANLICPRNAPGIAYGVAATDSNVTIVTSFLSDTPDWQTIGIDPAHNPLLSTQAGVILRAQSATGQFINIQDAAAGTTNLKPATAAPIDYNEFVPAGSQTLIADTNTGRLTQSVNLTAGFTSALLIKPGPQIVRVFPAASAVSPLSVAPGTFVSIYGANLAPSTTQASTVPLPTMLNGTEVLVNGTPVPLQIVTPGQINAILPVGLSGVATVSVLSPNGQHTVNVLLAPAVPALFTQNSAGTGLASVLNAVTNVPVSAAAPLHAGDFAAIYLTGLGVKSDAGTAVIAPTVSVAGQPCLVQYAGVAPGFAGLDQIDCQIPAGLGANTAATLTVTANGRVSNTATLILQ